MDLNSGTYEYEVMVNAEHERVDKILKAQPHYEPFYNHFLENAKKLVNDTEKRDTESK